MKKYDVLFLCIQEHWLPHHEAKQLFETNFPQYNFHTTSSDMFLHPEDLSLESGPVWHGCALGWPNSINTYTRELPIVSDRFCGVLYQNKKTKTNILSYSLYLPTSGRDEDFLDVLDCLSKDIDYNITDDCAHIIGTNINQSD